MSLHYYRLLVLLAGFLIGCGGGDDNRPTVVAAGGTVALDGQPLPDAKVVLIPISQSRPAAYAVSDADGTFALTTFEQGDGAVPGEYLVTVTKQQAENPMTTEESAAYFARTGTPPPAPTFVDLIPAQYRDAASSGLKVQVEPDGKNRFVLELLTPGGVPLR